MGILDFFKLSFVYPKWLAFFAATLLSILRREGVPGPDLYKTQELYDKYDYIIVGGGSAGCVLANRLSADKSKTVLLLEAGGVPDASTEVPMMAPLQVRTSIDWGYTTEPQKGACQSLVDKRSYLAQGKVLGGSSTINLMMVVRGNRHDYDSWQKVYGAKRWSYKHVLPYFKSIENVYSDIPGTEDSGLISEDYRGRSGELSVGYPTSHTPISDAFLQAGRELGYDILDYNGPKQTGFSRIQANIKDGRRCSGAKAFITPIVTERKKNLHISLYSHVTKVLFNGSRAVGVEFRRDGETRNISARREVIISAGAVGSPRLLLLSGVGPEEDLTPLGIPVVANLPVGRNLQDHILIGSIAATINESADIDVSKFSVLLDYAVRRKGPLSYPAGLEAVAFVNTPFVNESLDHPDVEIVLLSVSPASGEYRRFYLEIGTSEKSLDQYYGPKKSSHAFQVAALINRLKSRGFIKLRSTDPYENPIIDPLYFSHPQDIDVAVAGARKAVDILKTRAFKKLGLKLWDIPFPGCEGKGKMWSTRYLRCLVRMQSYGAWHPCCTCPMGSDKRAVVDHRLRVRGGIEGLRVIDASVMPAPLSGNMHVPTMMIGAKGAAMIIEDNK